MIFMMNYADRIQRTLTAGVLREKLGDYLVIQNLIRGKADDYIFDGFNLIDRKEYVACKLWYRGDIADELKKLGYKGTNDQIEKVLKKSSLEEDLEAATEDDWNLIESACDEAGFEDVAYKKWPWIWKGEDCFEEFCKDIKEKTVDEKWYRGEEADYICSLSCGSICYDLMCIKDSNGKRFLRLDLFVGGIDTGYGYRNGYPYTDVPEIDCKLSGFDSWVDSMNLTDYIDYIKKWIEDCANASIKSNNKIKIGKQRYSLVEKLQEPMEW